MDLSIQKLTKEFNTKLVFSDLTFDIRSGSRFAITGANGSGKSTLLKIISGATLPTSGKIHYQLNGKQIGEAQLFRFVHFIAPYNTMIEELNIEELFDLHHKLGLLKSYTHFRSWFQRLEYPFNPAQQIKMFSSGMKQRIKLAISLLDDRPLILLDEPGSNLDLQGKGWFQELLDKVSESQTVVIATNDPLEIRYCKENVNLDIKTSWMS